MINTNAASLPWHGLPLYFADHDIEKVLVGLAVITTLAKTPTPEQQELWQAYFCLRGTKQQEIPETDFLPQDKWLDAAAFVASALPGGAVLSSTLKKLEHPEKIPAKIAAAYNPVFARLEKHKAKTALALAAKTICLWQTAWNTEVKFQQTAKTPLATLIQNLCWLEPHDFVHLPKPLLQKLKDVHLALVLSQEHPAKLHVQGLEQVVDGLTPFFEVFKSPRFDGFGEKAKRASFNQPHGYSNTPKGLFKTLMAENVWLKSLPVYWQGALLAPEEQEQQAEIRQEGSLKAMLETAMALKAYQTSPTASSFDDKGLTRKKILEGLITDLTQRKEQ